MFGGLLILRLRAAEQALVRGRWDEAFRLATAPDLREHRRGAAVLLTLAEKFVERARGHFAEERFTEALLDLDRAALAGAKPDVVTELRRQVRTVAEEVSRQEKSRRRKLDEVKERVAAGSILAGRQLLAGADRSDPEARRLAKDIESRERQATEGFAHVEALIGQDQWSAAIERFRKVRRLHPQDGRALALETRMAEQAAGRARGALTEGRIRRAAEELAVLGEIGNECGARRDLADLVHLAESASRALAASDFAKARRSVLRLTQLAPDIKWIAVAAKELGTADELVTALQAGPLGEHARQTAHAPRSVDLAETMAVAARSQPADGLPTRLVVLLDGGGSFLLLRGDRITLGRAMTAHPPDVPILSDLAERHAEITRVEEDYFLFSTRDVEINGRVTRHQLLREGDRVILARHGRFSFRLPHRASGSALLEMANATTLPQGVRRVVLFRQTAMIGPGSAAHIHSPAGSPELVLFERGGQLWLRPHRPGRGDAAATHVPLGEPMEFEGVSLIVQPWKTAPVGPSFT